MKHNRSIITRRSILTSIGLAGTGAALGGVGTQAFFSDSERYPDNNLVAGELDLMVDWEVHYSDWSPDEEEAAPNLRMVDDPQSIEDGEVALPSITYPEVAVPEDEFLAFWEATAQSAFPDSDGDGLQDIILTRDQLSNEHPFDSPEEIEARYRAQFANVPDDLPAPLIELQDVKPGDFGEITFSLHLFNNPGYLWMNGELLAHEENGITEPEADDPDEDGTDTAEFLDSVETLIWHDDGDNVHEDLEMVHSPHDVGEPTNITLSGSESVIMQGTLGEVLDALESDNGIPLDADPREPPRECFPNSTTRYIGFAWWLPPDHANEIQTDRALFDLGFYTEQCRHNDGSGLTPEFRPNLTIQGASVGGPDNETSGVIVDLHNSADEAITITDIGIDNVGSLTLLSDDSVSSPENWGAEVYIDADDTDGKTDVAGGVSLPGQIDLDTDGYNSENSVEAVMSGGSNAELWLYAFRDGSGAVDMTGRSFELTIDYMRDGSPYTQQKTITL